MSGKCFLLSTSQCLAYSNDPWVLPVARDADRVNIAMASRGAKTLIAVASVSVGVVWLIHHNQKTEKEVSQSHHYTFTVGNPVHLVSSPSSVAHGAAGHEARLDPRRNHVCPQAEDIRSAQPRSTTRQ